MNSKSAIVGILASVALLTGCATKTSVKSYAGADYVYQEDQSRARNIANFFGFTKIKDTQAPEGFKGDGSVLWNSAVWAGNLDAAANIGGPLPGVSGWGAVGLGLGLGLLQSAFTPKDQEFGNHVFGYLPANQAKDTHEAKIKFVEQVGAALIKTANQIYPEAKVYVNYRYDNKGGLMTLPNYRLEVIFIDAKKGCLERDFCRVNIQSVFAEEPSQVNKLFSTKGMAYKMMPAKVNNTIWTGSDFDDNYDFPKLMAGMAMNMPKDTFIYVATQKNNKGEKNPPFIVEKGRVDFFVSPQAKK